MLLAVLWGPAGGLGSDSRAPGSTALQGTWNPVRTLICKGLSVEGLTVASCFQAVLRDRCLNRVVSSGQLTILGWWIAGTALQFQRDRRGLHTKSSRQPEEELLKEHFPIPASVGIRGNRNSRGGKPNILAPV